MAKCSKCHIYVANRDLKHYDSLKQPICDECFHELDGPVGRLALLPAESVMHVGKLFELDMSSRRAVSGDEVMWNGHWYVVVGCALYDQRGR